MNLPPEVEKAWQTLAAALPPDSAMSSIKVAENPDETGWRAAGEAARSLTPLLRAALYIYADDLDRAHTIVQVFDYPEAAYWHGFLHRREGDYANANYWFRRAGKLPADLGQDPIALTDQFASLGRKDDVTALIERQRREWQALFEHCAKETK